jgi:hypothetical protein
MPRKSAATPRICSQSAFIRIFFAIAKDALARIPPNLQYIKGLRGYAVIVTTEVYARLNIEMKRKVPESVRPQRMVQTPPLGLTILHMFDK